MKTTTMMAIVTLACCSGCIDHTDQSDNTVTKTNVQTRYLCVGMEMSKRFGACPGCALDAKNMTTLLSDKLGYSGDTLISEQATRSAVMLKLMDGIANTPSDGLFLFCYSGHGGQECLGGKEPDGSDREDEYLCLYDSYMKDDEIWDIISKCKGRVFLYFDACHSATMYRSVVADSVVISGNTAVSLAVDNLVKSSGFTFSPGKFIGAVALSTKGIPSSFSMLCWSGCQEAEYSYGASNGGVMTRAVMRNWSRGILYGDLWTRVSKDVKSEQSTQNPAQTVVGFGFADMEAFR